MPTLKQQLHNSATHAKGYDPACPECTEVAYIAIGPNVWGKGKTINAAVKNCRAANNNHKPSRIGIYQVEHTATVNEVNGGINFLHGAPLPVLVYQRVEKRVTVNTANYRE